MPRSTVTMLPRSSRVRALLCLTLFLNVVAAGRLGPYRRQDDTLPTTTEDPKTTRDSEVNQSATTSADTTDTPETTPAESPTVDVTSSVTSSLVETAIPSAINGNNPDTNNMFDNSTIVEGELPLTPRLTPGWGVSGAILLISGIVYALIGIKNAWLHTFFSTAYLASLSVTVLIVYVMVPPVPDAVQGAYVVAAVCTGLILGGAATIFKELTEGLGCLLGGFCVAMWLLTLREGGLLPSTTGKVIFITVFTLVGYGFYFSRYTRPYALIGLMSFAGATVTVLGIDCFSKAGLKEFWAYIWGLNENLFPLAATTYPLTKGIKVEIAVVVVLTIVGVISQLKLWRVVQEHRAKRAEDRAEAQRQRDEEEANVGRQIEEDNARERRQWETVYGDQPPSSSGDSGDSGVADVDNEKKGRLSQTTVKQVSSIEDAIEMEDLPASPEQPKHAADGLVVPHPDQDNKVTVRVARDEIAESDDAPAPMAEPDEKIWVVGDSGETRPASIRSVRNSQRLSRSTAPEITPLPFTIPDVHEEADRDEDRSSFATFADEDDRSITLTKRASRGSFGNRLSVGSANLLRSLSQQSHRSQKSKRKTGEFESPQPSPKFGDSTEDLVAEKRERSDDARSMAATVDNLSLEGSDRAYSVQDDGAKFSVEITAQLADNATKAGPGLEDVFATRQKPASHGKHLDVRPYSTAETVATDILNPSAVGETSGSRSKRSSTTNGPGKTEGTNENTNPTDTSGTVARSDSAKAPKSASPSVSSSRGSLTKDRLPPGLSRVALSYRTNEWAKHLSQAESPVPENLQLNEYPEPQAQSSDANETPAPVNVDELQQTPEAGIPAAAARRPVSMTSNAPVVPTPVYRSGSRASLNLTPPRAFAPPLTVPGNETQDDDADGAQPNPLPTNYSFRKKGKRHSQDTCIQPIQEENGEEHLPVRQSFSPEDSADSAPNSSPSSPTGVEPRPSSRSPVPGIVSYSSPQTLLGKREMFLRQKSQSTLFAPPITEDVRPASQVDSPHNYPISSPFASRDADDIPLSQRKELMRQSSRLSVNSVAPIHRMSSAMSLGQAAGPSPTPTPPSGADNKQFNSHQPQRHSTLPSQMQRESRLANFRGSVAADLRAGTPITPSGNNGRETPMINASSMSLLGALGPAHGNNDVRRNMDQQRNILLSQREQEAQRKEVERWEKERNQQAFEEMMRRGDLMDAHREAMRRLQGGVKDQ